MLTKMFTKKFSQWVRRQDGANAIMSGRRLALAGAFLALGLSGFMGCTHGSDDTGGGSSAGSMSGATDPQGTQAMANRQGPPPNGGPYVAPPPAANGSGASSGMNSPAPIGDKNSVNTSAAPGG